jgi:hypothetical protein
VHIILTCIWRATAQKRQIFGFPWVPFKYRFECTCIPKRVDDSWVTMCLLLNTKWLNFQLYHGKNKLHSMRWCPPCTRLTSLVGLLWCLLAPQVDTTLSSGWHDTPLRHSLMPLWCLLAPQVDTTLHSDTP